MYFNWLENIQDWCISRQLWWGHRIPVWYPEDTATHGNKFYVARSAEEAQAKAEAELGAGVVLRQASLFSSASAITVSAPLSPPLHP